MQIAPILFAHLPDLPKRSCVSRSLDLIDRPWRWFNPLPGQAFEFCSVSQSDGAEDQRVCVGGGLVTFSGYRVLVPVFQLCEWSVRTSCHVVANERCGQAVTANHVIGRFVRLRCQLGTRLLVSEHSACQLHRLRRESTLQSTHAIQLVPPGWTWIHLTDVCAHMRVHVQIQAVASRLLRE